METPANQRVKHTQRDYTLAFKRSVIYQIEQSSLSYKQAQRKLAVKTLNKTASRKSNRKNFYKM